ncbi:putative regulator PrlF [compost metagenome]
MNYSKPTSPFTRIHARNESECIAPSEHYRELCEFLKLLEDDILGNPEKLIALDSMLLARLDSLIGGLDVDINSPLSADDE